MNIYEYNLLHWLIDCDPASPTMAVYQYKVQESRNCLAHKTGYLSWSLVCQNSNVGSSASEGNGLARQ